MIRKKLINTSKSMFHCSHCNSEKEEEEEEEEERENTNLTKSLLWNIKFCRNVNSSRNEREGGREGGREGIKIKCLVLWLSICTFEHPFPCKSNYLSIFQTFSFFLHLIFSFCFTPSHFLILCSSQTNPVVFPLLFPIFLLLPLSSFLFSAIFFCVRLVELISGL